MSSLTKYLPCRRVRIPLLLTLLVLQSGTLAAADERWQFAFVPHLSLVDYYGSKDRKSMQLYSGLLRARYLDDRELSLGYTFSQVDTHEGNIKEDLLQLGAKHRLYPSWLNGSLGMDVQLFSASAKATNIIPSSVFSVGRMGRRTFTLSDASVESFNSKFITAYISAEYLDYAKTHNLMFAFANTQFDADDSDSGDGKNRFRQVTLELGFAWPDEMHWVSFVPTLIEPDQAIEDKDRYLAGNVVFTRWFESNGLGLDSYTLNLALGDRVFFVDGRASVVYSVADVQTGAVSLNLDWKLEQERHMNAYLAYDRYRNVALADNYASFTVYFGIQLPF